jgi:hypothetical protein
MIEQLERECWNLDNALAEHILPRLLYYKNWLNRWGIPSDLEEDEWNEILEELCWTFMYLSGNYESRVSYHIDGFEHVDGFGKLKYLDKAAYLRECAKDKRNEARADNGLKLFAEYYRGLWD